MDRNSKYFVEIKTKEGEIYSKTGPYPTKEMAKTMAQTYEAIYRDREYTTTLIEDNRK